MQQELPRYFYQNPATNQASSSSISTQQLCRILCPTKATTNGMTIRPDSLLLGFDSKTREFSTEGWRMAKHMPVLRESCSNWYYENFIGTQRDGKKNGVVEAGNKVYGPISCRELSQRFHDQKNYANVHLVKNTARVWSPEIAQQKRQDDQQKERNNERTKPESEWRSIAELPQLQTAIKAFVEAPTPWSFEHDPSQADTKTNGSSNTAKTKALNRQGKEEIKQFDLSVMVYNDEDETLEGEERKKRKATTTSSKKDQDEVLESFLSSTENVELKKHEDEEYESDGGTFYAKHHQTRNWLPADLLPNRKRKLKEPYEFDYNKEATSTSIRSDDNTLYSSNLSSHNSKRKKNKKPKFKSKNAKCWIYITNLPRDTSEEELVQYFSKVGIIDLDPDTQKPKVKLYHHKHAGFVKKNNGEKVAAKVGQLKGDASICFARPESVDLALHLLDDSMLRPLNTSSYNTDDVPRISVQRAKFEQHGDQYHGRRIVSNAKRKVARLAALQAIGWDEGDNGRITGGLKGLRIIVLKRMFSFNELQRVQNNRDSGKSNDNENIFLKKLERSVLKQCEQWGVVEKVTVFSKNVDGVVVVKFSQPAAASKAIEAYNGWKSRGQTCNDKIEASFWDGVTDFTVHDEEKEEAETDKRLDEFGDWLDKQELPDELRLNVEE